MQVESASLGSHGVLNFLHEGGGSVDLFSQVSPGWVEVMQLMKALPLAGSGVWMHQCGMEARDHLIRHLTTAALIPMQACFQRCLQPPAAPDHRLAWFKRMDQPSTPAWSCMGGVHDHAALVLDCCVDALVQQSLQFWPWALN